MDGEIFAVEGNIRFETGMSTPLAGRMTIGAGREVIMNDGGSVGAGGLILLEGTAANLATVSGLPLGVGLNGVIRADGVGVIENVLLLATGSILETPPGDPNSELRLAGTTFFQGGRILGDGIVRQIGNAIVEQNTEINNDTYDMDGIAGTTVITVNAGSYARNHVRQYRHHGRERFRRHDPRQQRHARYHAGLAARRHAQLERNHRDQRSAPRRWRRDRRYGW